MIFLIFDKRVPQWMTYEAIEAEPAKDNRFSVSDWNIDMTFKIAGEVYSVGMNEDNVEAFASSFESLDYDFKLELPARLAVQG